MFVKNTFTLYSPILPSLSSSHPATPSNNSVSLSLQTSGEGGARRSVPRRRRNTSITFLGLSPSMALLSLAVSSGSDQG